MNSNQQPNDQTFSPSNVLEEHYWAFSHTLPPSTTHSNHFPTFELLTNVWSFGHLAWQKFARAGKSNQWEAAFSKLLHSHIAWIKQRWRPLKRKAHLSCQSVRSRNVLTWRWMKMLGITALTKQKQTKKQKNTNNSALAGLSISLYFCLKAG